MSDYAILNSFLVMVQNGTVCLGNTTSFSVKLMSVSVILMFLQQQQQQSLFLLNYILTF